MSVICVRSRLCPKGNEVSNRPPRLGVPRKRLRSINIPPRLFSLVCFLFWVTPKKKVIPYLFIIIFVLLFIPLFIKTNSPRVGVAFVSLRTKATSVVLRGIRLPAYLQADFVATNLSAENVARLGIRLPAYLQADSGARKGLEREGSALKGGTMAMNSESPVALRRCAQIKIKNKNKI